MTFLSEFYYLKQMQFFDAFCLTNSVFQLIPGKLAERGSKKILIIIQKVVVIQLCLTACFALYFYNLN